MALMRESTLADLLACPRCRSRLRSEGTEYVCGCGFVGRRAGQWPVLVDFEQSILREGDVMAAAGGSPIRRQRVPRWVAALRGNRAGRAHRSGGVDRVLGLLDPGARVVVVGGGADQHGLRPLYASPAVEVIGFDIYGSDLVQFIADAHAIPLGASTVDGVIIQAVLEHVLDPPRVVSEIHRVLKPGGIVYAETAFMQQVHEGPYDFTRYTESGHRWLFRNFDAIDSATLNGPFSQLVWTLDYLTRSLLRSQTAGRVVHKVLNPIGWLDRRVPSKYSTDVAPAVYFLGRRAEVGLKPSDMVGYYKGAQ